MPYIGTKRYETVDCRVTLSSVASQNRGNVVFECQWPPTNADLLWCHNKAIGSMLISGLYLDNIDIVRLAGERCRLSFSYHTDNQSLNENGNGMRAEPPRYTLRASCTQEPLLTHPKLKNAGDEVLEALKALMDGATMGSEIDTSVNDKKKIKDIIAGDSAAMQVARLIIKGTTVFYNPTLTWQERVSARNMNGVSVSGLGKIASPPGGAPSGGGRNYLFTSVDADMDGTGQRVDVVRNYELSGPDGWDAWLYR